MLAESRPPTHTAVHEQIHHLPDQRKNLVSAYDLLFEDLKDSEHVFTENDIFRYHHVLGHNLPQMKDVPPCTYAQRDRMPDNMPWQVYLFTEPSKIPTEMGQFTQDFNDYMHFKPHKPEDAVIVIENAADVKIRFTNIHPFPDGNGRLGRLLTDGVLLSGGLYQMPHWLDPKTSDPIRQKLSYFAMMRLSSEQYPAFLLRFMVIQQLKALNSEIDAIVSNSQALLEASNSGYLANRRQTIASLEEYSIAINDYIMAFPPPQLPRNPNFSPSPRE